MYDIILFGGTDEGHKIADFLIGKKISHIVCVATDYGASMIKNTNIRIGRMDEEQMRNFFLQNSPELVIDATHPYAEKVTENIKNACECKYIRVARADYNAGCGRAFDRLEQAVDYLKTKNGEILITTGSKEIIAFADLADRAYARVLETDTSVKLCKDAGFGDDRIITGMPPFSKEDNSRLMRDKNIKYLITKSTGKNGGFDEKIEAARENNVECVIIKRPSIEDGLTVEETEKEILKLL